MLITMFLLLRQISVSLEQNGKKLASLEAQGLWAVTFVLLL